MKAQKTILLLLLTMVSAVLFAQKTNFKSLQVLPQKMHKVSTLRPNALLDQLIFPGREILALERKWAGKLHFEDRDTVYSFYQLDHSQQAKDAEQAISMIVRDRVRYPIKALDNGISGQVILVYVVEKDGSLSNVQILEDLGYGCGAAVVQALSAIERIPPVMHMGVPVRSYHYQVMNFILR